MKQTILIFTLAISSIFNQVRAQKITPEQLKKLEGLWLGTLTYLDYTTAKPFTMPSNTTFAQSKNDPTIFLRSVGYSTEPHANQKDSMIISKNGTMLDDFTIIAVNNLNDTTLQIIGQKKDVDGNDHQKATIKRTYQITPNTFINKKEVLFEGTTQWITRHQYTYQRIK